MSSVDTNNLLENMFILQRNLSPNKIDNSIKGNQSEFLRIFQNEDSSGGGERNYDIASEQQRSVVHEKLGIVTSTIYTNSEVESLSFLSALSTEELSIQSEIISEEFDPLLNGEYAVVNREIVDVDGVLLNAANISGLHNIASNAFDIIFNQNLSGVKQPISVVSSHDEAQSILLISVPLKGIATGNLSQSINYHLSRELYQDSSESAKVKMEVGDKSGSTINQVERSVIDSSRGNSSFNNALLAARIIDANNSVSDITKKANLSQYASTASQATHELLAKKYTFFMNDDGLSLWYRDYQSSKDTIENELSVLKDILQEHSKIKVIGYNGKILYSLSTENTLLKGETNAS